MWSTVLLMLHFSTVNISSPSPNMVNYIWSQQLTVKTGLLTKDSYVHVDVGNGPLAEFG